ncbi:MAG: hypothetical protein AB7F40_07185 [Victivallaceae bacterium]|nr:BatA domain-containing protein [Victivallaceae bacterium]
MNLFFSTPYWGIAIGATGAAALVALYLWRRRAAQFKVPALFLWDLPEMRERGGRRFMPRRPPLPFYLELAALLAMAFASAGPFLLRPADMPPLAVVLDDSFSMTAAAGQGESPRAKGLALAAQLRAAYPGRRMVFVTAGAEPRVVSDSEAADPAALWRCADGHSDLAAAIALARGRVPGGELLVISDRVPEIELGADTGIAGFGSPSDNFAILNVRRGADRILLEIGNFSGRAQTAELRVSGRREQREKLEFAPGERRRLLLKIPSEERNMPLKVEIFPESDALDCDNRAILLPEDCTPVKYAIAAGFSEAALADLHAVLDGNPEFVPAALSAPELMFIPSGPPSAPAAPARLVWHESGAAAATADLITVKSGDRLSDGLSSPEARWAADPAETLPGEPLARRGRTALLTRSVRTDGGVDVHLNLLAPKSTVAATPFWPELFFNLAAETRALRPGPGYANTRHGELVPVIVPPEAGISVKVTLPDGTVRNVPAVGGRAYLAELPTGVSGIEAGTRKWEVAVSNFSAAESDLAGSATFRSKPENPPEPDEGVRHSLAFVGVLLALLLLALHQWLFAQKGRTV